MSKTLTEISKEQMRIFENIDCMEGMEKYKDILQSRKTLAIVDPPYEIGIDGQKASICKNPIENYSKDHDLILDTHVGSASSLIACEEFGIDYIGFELDTDYYNSAKERLEKARFIRENKKADECFVNDLALFSNGENKK